MSRMRKRLKKGRKVNEEGGEGSCGRVKRREKLQSRMKENKKVVVG